jgi:hypothetical protein
VGAYLITSAERTEAEVAVYVAWVGGIERSSSYNILPLPFDLRRTRVIFIQ